MGSYKKTDINQFRNKFPKETSRHFTYVLVSPDMPIICYKCYVAARECKADK